MVWTVVLEKKEGTQNNIVSVFFEGEHDASLAYRTFLKKSRGFSEGGRVLVMVPGRHSYVYFPKDATPTKEFEEE